MHINIWNVSYLAWKSPTSSLVSKISNCFFKNRNQCCASALTLTQPIRPCSWNCLFSTLCPHSFYDFMKLNIIIWFCYNIAHLKNKQSFPNVFPSLTIVQCNDFLFSVSLLYFTESFLEFTPLPFFLFSPKFNSNRNSSSTKLH